MAAATAPKLTAAQARKFYEAEVEVKQLERELEAAKDRREKLRDRYFDRIPLSDDVEERLKGIRVLTVGGVKIRVSPTAGGLFFRFAEYRKAGHPITEAMRAFVHEGLPGRRRTVTRAAGPTRMGAVEPT